MKRRYLDSTVGRKERNHTGLHFTTNCLTVSNSFKIMANTEIFKTLNEYIGIGIRS